jgi:nickel/cobalt exporter
MDFTILLQQGTAHAWLYLPVAIVLGALHGLEPGHSKTMMAAFIIAVRGTILQAALLGLSAAISHSLVIWALAALALKFGNHWNVESTEPYFLMGTGVIVIAMAAWTIWRIRRNHDHDHDESRTLKHSDGEVTLSIFEDGVPPQFRVAWHSEIKPIRLRTIREDGASQDFGFVGGHDLFWHSREEIPEPHAFRVEVVLRGPAGEETVTTEFAEHSHEDGDAHAREHAEQIRRRFDGREVTTPQIVLFGLTGGLMPCPAALSILLVCLQLKEFTLGFTVVAAFSLGLALTLVGVGVAAAWGLRKMSETSSRFNRIAERAPYLSSFVLIVLGGIFFFRGLFHLL